MSNINAVAAGLGVQYNEANVHLAQRLARISSKLDTAESASDFEAALNLAVAKVDAEGAAAMAAMVTGLVKAQEPKARVYKIKRSLKGARVKVTGFEGRSFSFGPVWESFVRQGKGPALTDELKVRAHAAYLGVTNAKTARFTDVLAALQGKLK